MNTEDFEEYVRSLGYSVNEIIGVDGKTYVQIANVGISLGELSGRTCEVAILKVNGNPWIPQAAIHVRPALIVMGTRATQASGVGPEWQYWSRRIDGIPTPRLLWAKILTILNEV